LSSTGAGEALDPPLLGQGGQVESDLHLADPESLGQLLL
jgi:hypothetical protein